MRTVLLDLNPQIKNFMDMEDSIYKNILYKRNFTSANGWNVNIVQEDNGDIFYSETNYEIRCNKNRYYLFAVNKHGFSLKGKKFTIWFGENMTDLIFRNTLYPHLKLGWLENDFTPFITKPIFRKILLKQITNVTDIAKHYLKSQKIDIPPAIFVKFIRRHRGLDKHMFIQMINVAENHLHVLDYLDNDKNMRRDTLTDTMSQAFLLNRKINFKWHQRHLDKVHKEWTKELMLIEAQYIENFQIPNLELLPELPKEFTLLRSVKEIFAEGKTMSNCVYTNYRDRIMNNEILVFHVNIKGEETTLGVNWYLDPKKMTLLQNYQAHNKMPSEYVQKKCNQFILYLRRYTLNHSSTPVMEYAVSTHAGNWVEADDGMPF